VVVPRALYRTELSKAASAGSPLAPRPLAFPVDPRIGWADVGAPFSVVIPTLRNGEHRRLAFDPVHEPMLARDAARPVALQGVP